ncbi:MAG TPA: hypothetical protein P5186_13810 [Candidatus Paceibacterota bacterium]|nr:hypothetical protein [Candidatus Paceibacterota bacterium]
MKTAHMFDFRLCHPRRNLPLKVARKRGESNFVSAFARAYIASVAPHGIGGSEFSLSGYGIADFVWLAWRRSAADDDGTAISAERIKHELGRRKLTAFEMKLSDWRKGISQTYRYSYFADVAILVLPPETAALALAEIDIFRRLGVGLWSFHKASKKISKLFTPGNSRARNVKAREKALDALTRSVQLSKFFK